MSSLSCFVPRVQEYLDVILKRGRVGLSPGCVKISSGMPSCPPYLKEALCDRFKVTVPYAGLSLSWDIVFCAKRPDYPPDFIFAEDSFPLELTDVDVLGNWVAKDSSCLLTAVQQVLHQYGKYQVSLLTKHSRVHFEYSALLQQGFTNQDLEIFVSPKARGPVNFLIKLPIDFSKLPPILTRENPDEDSALLLAVFQTAQANQVSPRLFLSPKVEHSLGGAQQWCIPDIPINGRLVDYVSCIIKLLERKVEQISESYQKRKEYVSSFITHFDGSLLEYDAESFTKLSFLLERNDFYFILIINLPRTFPSSKPSFTFQSIYHKTSDEPCSVTITDYPYSPRWPVSEMLNRASDFLQEYVPVFQSMSVKD